MVKTARISGQGPWDMKRRATGFDLCQVWARRVRPFPHQENGSSVNRLGLAEFESASVLGLPSSNLTRATFQHNGGSELKLLALGTVSSATQRRDLPQRRYKYGLSLRSQLPFFVSNGSTKCADLSLLFILFHFITYSLGCGASCDSSDILA